MTTNKIIEHMNIVNEREAPIFTAPVLCQACGPLRTLPPNQITALATQLLNDNFRIVYHKPRHMESILSTISIEKRPNFLFRAMRAVGRVLPFIRVYRELDTSLSQQLRCYINVHPGSTEERKNVNRIILQILEQQRLIPSGIDAMKKAGFKNFEAMKKAADANDSKALVVLGKLYAHGAAGLTRSIDLSIEAFQRASNNGDISAKNHLGRMLSQRAHSTEDLTNAYQLFATTAKGNDPEGLFLQASCLYQGLGVQQDIEQAITCAQQSITCAKTTGYNCSESHELLSTIYIDQAKATDNQQERNTRFEQAKKELEHAIAMGSPSAMNKLGNLYTISKWIGHSFSEAARWYRKAALRGDIHAIYNLGVMYNKGQWYSLDHDKGDRLIMLAAEQGCSSALFSLGALSEHGVGQTPDLRRARNWYEAAIELGNVKAMVNFANMLLQGRGVDQDIPKAKELFKKAASFNNKIAICNLGMLAHEDGKAKEARALLDRSAALGCDTAVFNIGIIEDKSRGRAAKKRAFAQYKLAAEMGNIKSMYNTACMLYQGEGTKKDYAAALLWYLRAANNGHVNAMNNLARMYQKGKGVAKNVAAAEQWYAKAALQNNAAAMFNLGLLYLKAIPADLTKAKYWLNRAQEGGITQAGTILAKNKSLKQFASQTLCNTEATAKMTTITLAEEQASLAKNKHSRKSNVIRLFWGKSRSTSKA